MTIVFRRGTTYTALDVDRIDYKIDAFIDELSGNLITTYHIEFENGNKITACELYINGIDASNYPEIKASVWRE